MPDVKGREQILRVHTRKIPLAQDVNLSLIARGTPGLSGAELSNVVNEAALLAARRNKQAVDMRDLEDAKDKVMFGVERKSRVLSEEERTLIAYHEAGHALVSLNVPGADPLHKVTIVPRGRALGITAYLPEEELHKYTKQSILGRLATAYGGRCAEEVVFGPDKVTTGAAQDIQVATSYARRMVTQFGMSDAVGPIAVGDREAEIFLGREIVQRREISERTAELVDNEVKRILEGAFERAKAIISEHRDSLDRLARALLERDTLDREEVDLVFAGKPLPPQVSTPDPKLSSGAPAAREKATPARRAALGARARHAQPAWVAATGLEPVALLLEGITEDDREALVGWAARAGADLLTGEGWALVCAVASRLAPLARADRVPAGLESLSPALARFLAAYTTPPRRSVIPAGEIPLDQPVLVGIVHVPRDPFSLPAR